MCLTITGQVMGKSDNLTSVTPIWEVCKGSILIPTASQSITKQIISCNRNTSIISLTWPDGIPPFAGFFLLQREEFGLATSD